MTQPAFPARIIQTIITVTPLGGGSPQTYTFQQHRQRVSITQGGGQYGNARVEIYGVSLTTMNAIGRMWLQSLTPQNMDTIQINVWNGQTFTPLFSGTITWAEPDASGMPHVKLSIEANASFALSNQTASPYSNPGPVTLSAALTQILQGTNYTLNFSSTATNYTMTNVRASGTPMDQVIKLVGQYPDLVWWSSLDQICVRKALAPLGSGSITINVQNGLQASPVYSSSGLTFTTLFNPQIIPGAALNVQTEFNFVSQTLWVAAVIQHDIEANVPGGAWSTSVAANSFGPLGNNNGQPNS
jgi:hypothetical protein